MEFRSECWPKRLCCPRRVGLAGIWFALGGAGFVLAGTLFALASLGLLGPVRTEFALSIAGSGLVEDPCVLAGT